MAKPVGEDNWLAYLEEAGRQANDLETRVNVIELFKTAVGGEPDSLKTWSAYCEYFWSLYNSCNTRNNSPDNQTRWSEEEQQMGRELFSLDAALALWQQAYEAIKYRLGDSHILWNRWISLEMEQLAQTRMPEGVQRITYLYRDRLQIPHTTWDDTSQMFSSFLSEYNRSAWEDTMKDVTSRAQTAKRLMQARDAFELKLKQAIRSGDEVAQRANLREYLDWEIAGSMKNHQNRETAINICCGLFGRALTSLFATDDGVWNEYAVYLSAALPSTAPPPQSLLDTLQRAVDHCPWSGTLWSRYILCAEEAKLPFYDIEKIKHAATSNPDLYKGGMTGLLDMYVAWCGFLKRTAMDINASDEAVDIADVGLGAAIEDVAVLGGRIYGKEYKGDPSFRLERIYIQYLTEKKASVEDARNQWDNLARKQLHSDSYDFWLNYYLWEMMIFASRGKDRSPTPSTATSGLRVPSLATAVLARAINTKTMDWPERVMEIYLQHCNDYEHPATVRHAIDSVHKIRKLVAKRREREAADAAEAYAAQEQQAATAIAVDDASDSPSASKRKRSPGPEETETEMTTKRHKNEPFNDAAAHSLSNEKESQKRDRENTTIIVTGLPADATLTKVRQYFKEYGHINSLSLVQAKRTSSSTSLIEFKTPEDAQSALLRNGKYFGEAQITVRSGTDLTLFVTNYPPAADDAYIRKLFQDCGEILSIRRPSLRYNTHRRFCYVSFEDKIASAKATAMDGTILEGRYKLTAKYSNPAEKKAREGAVAEGREVCVSNLDPAATEDDIRDIFAKYGNIGSVRILRSMGGKSFGTAFVVFEDKHHAGLAASELDNTKLRRHIIQVKVSIATNFKPVAKSTANHNSNSAASSPAPLDNEGDEAMCEDKGMKTDGGASHPTNTGKPTSAEIKAKTISLLGLSDTVNDARVRALAEPIGEIVKIVLQPGHGGAKVEFVDAATAGRASLQLDGKEFDGRKLRVGTVDELRHEKGEVATDRMAYGGGISTGSQHKQSGKSKGSVKGLMPQPFTAKRPVLGKGGAKRGLGFVAAINKANASGTEQKSNGPSDGNTNGVPAKKSNADFKALFLNSPSKRGKDQNATTEP
jgi:squamous cell carcinoma antigen recognized by T-cells 3